MDQIEAIGKGIGRRQFLGYGLKAGALMGLLGTSGGLAACAAPSQPAVAEEVLNQLNWLFNVQFAGFWAAQEKGYFTEQKITPKFQPGGPNVQPETIVAQGAVQVGMSGAVANLIKAVVSGAKVKAIAACYQNSPNGLMSLPAKPVRSLQDAIGKKIGLQPGARSTWSALLKRANIDAGQMEIVQVGADPAPLASGQVDAFWCFVINQPLTLKSQGIETVVMTQSDLGVPGGANFIIATHDAIAQKKDMLARYLKAVRKGWEYNETHADEISQLTVDKIAPDQKLNIDVQKAQNAAQIPFTQSELTKQKGLLYNNEADWEAAVKFLVDSGDLEKAIPVTDVMTTEILTAAFG